MSNSTRQIENLQAQINEQFNSLKPVERSTSYANLLTEVLQTIEKRLEESRETDLEKTFSRV